MAGSAATVTYDKQGQIRRVIIDWTSDDTTGAVSTTTNKISGFLVAGVTDPDGTAAPTADYDITITDEEGVNVLGNCFDDLADRHTSTSERVDFFLNDGTYSTGASPAVNDKLTVAVTNAGNSKQGRIVLYVNGWIF